MILQFESNPGSATHQFDRVVAFQPSLSIPSFGVYAAQHLGVFVRQFTERILHPMELNPGPNPPAVIEAIFALGSLCRSRALRAPDSPTKPDRFSTQMVTLRSFS